MMGPFWFWLWDAQKTKGGLALKGLDVPRSVWSPEIFQHIVGGYLVLATHAGQDRLLFFIDNGPWETCPPVSISESKEKS